MYHNRAIWEHAFLSALYGFFIEVNLEDMRPTDKSFDLLGFDGALQFPLRNTRFRSHYLVDSDELVILSKIRNEIAHG